MTLRLILVAHAPTRATMSASFPLDEGIIPERRAEAEALAGSFGPVDAAWTSPARRAGETAAALGLPARVAPPLRARPLGRVAGPPLASVSAADAAGLLLWTMDTARAPHGGEPIDDLFERVEAWLAGLRGGSGRVVAVTHAAVVRAVTIAALRADPLSVWRIDVVPLSVSEFHANGARWSVCGLNRPGGGAFRP